jgi:hypothetical protein
LKGIFLDRILPSGLTEYEWFTEVFREKATQIERLSHETVSQWIERHEEFVEERLDGGKDFKYESDVYGFPVTTKQEKKLQLYTANSIEEGENEYTVVHSPYSKSEPIPTDDGNQQATLGSQFK